MGKIQVTENELKQIIRESVEGVIKEARWNNYGMNWDQLSEPEKQAYAKRYGNTAGANTDTYVYGAKTGTQTDYEKLGQYYAQQQKKKANKAHRNGYSAEFFNQVQTQLNNYKDALTQIQQALTGPLKEEKLNEAELPSWYFTGRTASPQQAQQATSTAQYTGNGGGTGGVRGDEPAQQQTTTPETGTNDILSQVPQIVKQIQDMKKDAQLVPGLQQKVKQLTTQNQSLQTRLANAQNSVSPVNNAAKRIASAQGYTPSQPGGFIDKGQNRVNTQPGLTRTMTPGTARA